MGAIPGILCVVFYLIQVYHIGFTLFEQHGWLGPLPFSPPPSPPLPLPTGLYLSWEYLLTIDNISMEAIPGILSVVFYLIQVYHVSFVLCEQHGWFGPIRRIISNKYKLAWFKKDWNKKRIPPILRILWNNPFIAGLKRYVFYINRENFSPGNY